MKAIKWGFSLLCVAAIAAASVLLLPITIAALVIGGMIMVLGMGAGLWRYKQKPTPAAPAAHLLPNPEESAVPIAVVSPTSEALTTAITPSLPDNPPAPSSRLVLHQHRVIDKLAHMSDVLTRVVDFERQYHIAHSHQRPVHQILGFVNAKGRVNTNASIQDGIAICKQEWRNWHPDRHPGIQEAYRTSEQHRSRIQAIFSFWNTLHTALKTGLTHNTWPPLPKLAGYERSPQDELHHLIRRCDTLARDQDRIARDQDRIARDLDRIARDQDSIANGFKEIRRGIQELWATRARQQAVLRPFISPIQYGSPRKNRYSFYRIPLSSDEVQASCELYREKESIVKRLRSSFCYYTPPKNKEHNTSPTTSSTDPVYTK
ncbi:MAG: hypothetical protein A3J38_10080 [Gammaproteobacteria bacterium RIFCSPHIGHO2_12_FULL_45_9]|nr:MAG: hypothetical protein A3J38_10080 [Gammaproteobacteria bacterium RIFCSPHIGHO2_12_FULL_45_9]